MPANIAMPLEARSSSLPSVITAPSSFRLRRQVLYQEQTWRQPAHAKGQDADGVNILASRWIDERTVVRLENGACSRDRYVIGVALRPTRLRIRWDREAVFEGTMPAGMVHVTEPGQAIEAEFFTPCDFVHFHVAAGYLRARQAASSLGLPKDDGRPVPGEHRLRSLLVRDELAARLSRTLTEGLDFEDPLYAESVGSMILMRVLALRAPVARTGALPRWRLRRVQDHLAVNLSEAISLADLASAAGLSRMHFAAQFRVATGHRPHEYVLQHRIECAQQMLASTDTPLVQVALAVGFQTQSHFSTVFKRLTGETPARWRRANRSS